MFKIITIEELLNELDRYKYKEFHIHHTWKPNHASYSGSNAISLQKAMRDYHIKHKGWSDIGQHVSLFPDGNFVTGRDFGRTPASILGHNIGAFMCEMVGNFDSGSDILEGDQKKNIIKLAKYFDNKGAYVRFHRENSNKTCPGSSISKSKFIKEVEAVVISSHWKCGSFWTRQLQELCNEALFCDKYDKALKVDGIWGRKTERKVPNIKKNSTKKYFVGLIQKILLEKGYKLPRFGADKNFGEETEKAVRQFQKDNNLVQDGIVGKLTWYALVN